LPLDRDTPIKSEVVEDDLYPPDKQAQQKLTSLIQRRFQIADRNRSAHEEVWNRYYKSYRSYRKRRKPGQWKSNVWMPITFYVIETILPRIAASIPSAKVDPQGPEDVVPAETLEELLEWAEDVSDLYPEQVKAVKSALMYGTGILKTGPVQRMGANIKREPLMQETTVQVATGELDIDGNPLMQTQQTQVPVTDPKTGEPQMTATREEYVQYLGPQAQCVDITDFFPDPLGDDVQNCRWVIHRVYRDRTHIQKLIDEGIYRLPEDTDPKDWDKKITGSITIAKLNRLSEVELGGGQIDEENPKDVFPVLEMWTRDGEMYAVAGESGEGILLRAEKNPYLHGQIPFIKVIDHIVPHEFWGIGEIEPIEGIQDALNALWNSRLDNVKMSLNQMFAVVLDYLENPSDLVIRPGGIVRMREGLPLQNVFSQIDLGQVTDKAYTEAQELEREAEKASGVSPYQTGQDSPAYNRTATGVALISEQGNTRFSFKVSLAEHTGYKHLVRQFASLLQQYMPDELVIRIEGDRAIEQAQKMMMEQGQMAIAQGMPQEMVMMQQQQLMQDPQLMLETLGVDPMGGFKKVTPDGIMGRFDFKIDAESSAQTLSMRREQIMSLAQTAMQDPYFKPLPIRKKLVQTFGFKDVDTYLMSESEVQMMQMAAQQQQSAPGQESGGAEQQGVA